MKKKWIIFFIILIVAVVLVTIGMSVFNSSIEIIGNEDNFLYEEGNEDEIETISGTGTITSFNIESLDTNLWSNIDKVLVGNESVVLANQEILNVSSPEMTGKIYSTISGQFFEQEYGEKKIYTIYDLNNLGFEMEIEEQEASKVKIGQKVDVVITATNQKVTGRVCYISYIPQNETLKVKVKIDSSDKVKIGYTVKAQILLDNDIDSNVQVYDIKNSVPKIGKTVVTYKDNTTDTFESYEELYTLDEVMAMYEEMMAENQTNMDEVSEEYNKYWSDYWQEYWNGFYAEMYGRDLDDSENEDNPEQGID